MSDGPRSLVLEPTSDEDTHNTNDATWEDAELDDVADWLGLFTEE